MRILHISKYYAPFIGGIESMAQNAVGAFAEVAEQKVLCFNHEPGDKYEILNGVEILRCGCQLKMASQSISLTIRQKLHSLFEIFKPDIVLFHYPNPYVAHFLLKEIPTNTRLIVYWHLDITRQKWLGKLFYFRNKALLKRVDTIIATSPNYIEGSRYLSGVKEKCKVIPNCISEKNHLINPEARELAQKIKAQNEGKVVCLAVGRHTPYKGFDYLIKASEFLDDRFVVNIAGNGEQTEALKRLAMGNSKVNFLERISETELKAHFLASDIFCFSSVSKNEAFGIALAEAMFFGLPAVTFSIKGRGVNYVSINGETGIEVANKDIKAYAEAIKALAENPKLRMVYGNAAKKRVEKNFLFEEYKNKILEVVHG
jgi:glycosyltransferase involved in cell wall biosynthesis